MNVEKVGDDTVPVADDMKLLGSDSLKLQSLKNRCDDTFQSNKTVLA